MITLERIQIEHAPKLFELINSNRNFLSKWLPWVKLSNSISDSLEFITKNSPKDVFTNPQPYRILYNNEFIGLIDLHNSKKDNSTIDIGYWIAENYQGKG